MTMTTTPTPSAIRAQFEAWAQEHGLPIDRDTAVSYADDETQTAWSAVQHTANLRQAEADHDFKNFHRLLCERFGYAHDEKDWKRDQVSLIEWIARQQAAKVDAGMVELVLRVFHGHESGPIGWPDPSNPDYNSNQRERMRAALEAALSAQPAERQGEASPVAWRCRERNGLGIWRYIEYDTRSPDSYELRECEIEAVYLHPAAPVGVPDEIREALEFYAGGRHITALHIRDRKKGEPEGGQWWVAKRAELNAAGYSMFSEDDNGTENFVEGGEVAQAALDSLAAAPSAPVGVPDGLLDACQRVKETRDAWRSGGSGPHTRRMEAHVAAVDQLCDLIAAAPSAPDKEGK